jgi:Tfp pilus assembly protein PilO
MTPKKRSRPLWHLMLVVALGLLALNGLAFVTFTLPRLNRSRRAEERAATLRERLVAERAESGRLRRRAHAIQANVRDAQRFFTQTIRPMSEALAADLDAVENAVRASGLSADKRGYNQQPVSGAPLVRYTIRVPLTGPRAQTSMLLRQLERAPRFIVIDRVGVQDDQTRGQARFDVDLSTYYQSDAARQTKAADAHSANVTRRAQRR